MDRPSHVDRNIESLHRSKVQPAEVVIVDSSHGPETERVVQAWQERWSAVRRLYAPDTGTSRARNLGVVATASPLVLITDDDCIVHEDCVAEIIRAFEADPEVTCLTGAVHPYGTSRGNVAVAIKADVERQEWQGKVRPWGLGHSVNMSFRRGTYAWIGGFDEEMGPGTDLYAAEDLDILYRVLGAGGRVVYQPTAIIYHDQWRSRTQARKRRADYARGTAAFLTKHVFVHRDGYALRMVPRRLWEDVPLLALIGLAKRNLELELVSFYQSLGLTSGFWVAGRHYMRRRRGAHAPVGISG